jgi:DNA-binding MarR family transcriptional regulator
VEAVSVRRQQKHGVTKEAILRAVAAQPGITLSALTRDLGLTKQNASAHVQGLRRLGLVDVSSTDRGWTTVVLTEAGGTLTVPPRPIKPQSLRARQVREAGKRGPSEEGRKRKLFEALDAILLAAYTQPGITTVDLRKVFGFASITLGKHIWRLRGMGWITRSRDHHWHRPEINLTAAGKAYVEGVLHKAVVRVEGLEPPRISAAGPKPAASTVPPDPQREGN